MVKEIKIESINEKARFCFDCKEEIYMVVVETKVKNLYVYPKSRLMLCDPCWNKRISNGTLAEVK